MTPTPTPAPDDLERVYERPRPAWTIAFLIGMLALYMVTYILVVTYGDQLAYPLGGRPQPFPAIPIPVPATPPPPPPLRGLLPRTSVSTCLHAVELRPFRVLRGADA